MLDSVGTSFDSVSVLLSLILTLISIFNSLAVSLAVFSALVRISALAVSVSLLSTISKLIAASSLIKPFLFAAVTIASITVSRLLFFKSTSSFIDSASLFTASTAKTLPLSSR